MNPVMTVVSICSRIGHTPGSQTTFDPWELKFAAQVAAAEYSENNVNQVKVSGETSEYDVNRRRFMMLFH
jgi:hypothetical protein